MKILSSNSAILALGIAAISTTIPALAQSVWLPSAGELVLTPGYVFSTFDTFRVGHQKVTVLRDNNASFDQHNGFVVAEYGIAPDLAADLNIGYVRAGTGDFAGFGRTSVDGLSDTSIGLRYRLLHPEAGSWVPNLAIRVAGIIEGSYDVAYAAPLNPGDGASGGEASLLFGSQFPSTGFGYFGDFGFRHRSEQVPQDLFGSFGIFQDLSKAGLRGVALSLAYRHTQGLSGGDIGGPGFGTLYGFPQVRERLQLVEGGIGYTDAGGRTYQFTVGMKIDGRNTGERTVYGFSVSFPLRLK
jgi:hypothetical protein